MARQAATSAQGSDRRKPRPGNTACWAQDCPAWTECPECSSWNSSSCLTPRYGSPGPFRPQWCTPEFRKLPGIYLVGIRKILLDCDPNRLRIFPLFSRGSEKFLNPIWNTCKEGEMYRHSSTHETCLPSSWQFTGKAFFFEWLTELEHFEHCSLKFPHMCFSRSHRCFAQSAVWEDRGDFYI